MYSRTLQYIFIKATLDIFKDAIIKIEHSISKGTFGEIYKTQPLNKEDINKIRKHMEDLIERDIPINKVQVSKEEAIKIF
ncbi:nucleoside kinase, partial [Clostridioides difficile]|nr:nucleoside kinase [Clostridioides difficile]